MKRININVAILFSIFLVLILFGCSTQNTPRQIDTVAVRPSQSQPTGYVFRTAQPGTATIKGELLVPSPDVALPDPNDAIFLVPIDTSQSVSNIPNFEVGTVPQADVDEATGEFVFTGIDKGTYAVVVLTMGGTQLPAHKYGSSDIQFITITDDNLDQTIEIGKISIP